MRRLARKIYISSDISIDEELDEISETEPLISLLWPWFLTFFDDWGRAKASPREIKNSVFQANDLVSIDVIKKALSLYSVNLIQLYEVGGKWYMCIEPKKWFKYQTHIRKEKRENDCSKIPAPLNEDDAQTRESTRDIAEISADSMNRANTALGATRDDAQTRANLANYTPSPSLSPSLNNSSYSNSPQNVFGVYEREIGKLSDTIRDMLIELELEFTEEWVKHSITNAVFQDVRKMSYISSTLKKWKDKNHPEPWTLEKDVPHPKKSDPPRDYRNKHGKQGFSNKPNIPMFQDSKSSTLSPEQRAAMKIKAQLLDGDGDG